MRTSMEVAGVAGILAGIGLAMEATFFMTSGWTPTVFHDPAGALSLFHTGGSQLRAAGFVGVLNLACAIIWLAGLAELHAIRARNLAAAILLFGIVGTAGHALVPLGLWGGIPTFLDASARHTTEAPAAFLGFAAFLDAAGAVGSLFVGFSLIAAGAAIVATRSIHSVIGWIGLLAGVASALSVLGAGTPLAPVAFAVYMPGLLLAIIFRTLSGFAMRRQTAVTTEPR
ncbi:MAG TPA: DUF4386 family protein [Gemmatimonadaceae bacterium]|nr:DUF4386 family protein [Gemmatimonadaceae bacterium]